MIEPAPDSKTKPLSAPTLEHVFQETGQFRILFPQPGDTLRSGDEVKIVWSRLDSVEDLRLELSTNGGGDWEVISDTPRNGQAWRLDPFSFSGWFEGDFPIFWFATMLVMAILGGLGVGTNSDWFVEAQRMQSADSLKGAVLAMLGGGISVVFRNGIWIGAILGLFTLALSYR